MITAYFIDLPYRILTETVGNLYVGGYERPFAVINVKVLVECGFIIHSSVFVTTPLMVT